MDLIRMYYKSTNIMPEVLLRHFLRSIGFYTEEVTDAAGAGEVPAVAEVYIIDNAYIEEYGSYIDVPDEKKAIVVLLDGWNIGALESGVKSISYRDNRRRNFLKTFIKELDGILEHRLSHKRLVRSMDDWQAVTSRIAEAYLQNQILEMAQYTKYFYKQERLFDEAFQHYERYLDALNRIADDYGPCDFLKYVNLYAQYELNLMCKNNGYSYYTPPDVLLEMCEGLLQKFAHNEELCLLRANIHFEFQDEWLRAWDEYQVEPVRHCSYVYYKCGRLARLYLKDYRQAIQILERVVHMKPDYYKAWYQIASCYESLGDYKEAITCFLNIGKVLEEKYQMHLLSPKELEYLYKAYIKIALINQNYLGNRLAAFEFNDIAERVRQDVEKMSYLEAIWPNAFHNKDLKSVIKEEMYNHMNVHIQAMY